MNTGRRAGHILARRFLFALICATASLQAALPLSLDADASLLFFEKKTADDPDDFLAWNQLGSRCLSRLRETGNIAWLDRATTAAAASLKAMPSEQNNGGLALQSRVLLAAHRMTEALVATRAVASTSLRSFICLS